MAGAGYKLFATGDVLTAAQVNTYLMEQTVMVFASATARNTALSGILAEGLTCYLKDTNDFQIYDGSTWVSYGSGDVTGITATSPLTGGGTSGNITVGIQDGTTAQKGAIQLTDSTSSTSTTTAATPNSVKSAYDLANGAIPKTLTTTTGDIIYASSANTPARLGIGSSNQVLTVSGGVPTWATPASSGGMTLLSTTTMSNRQTDLTSISGDYTDLVLIIVKASWSSYDSSIQIQPNGSSSIGHYIKIHNTNGTTSTYADSNTYINFPSNVANMAQNNSNNVQYVKIHNYANTTYYKPWIACGYYENPNGYSFIAGGAIKTNSAISSITLYNGQNITYSTGTVYLYGVK